MSTSIQFEDILGRFPDLPSLASWRQDVLRRMQRGDFNRMMPDDIYQALILEIQPRLLTDDEIEGILSKLPNPLALTKSVRENISDNIKNLLREQLKRVKMTPLGIPDLGNTIRRKFYKSMAISGSTVGQTAGEAMGQPITQMALNSFHASGSAKNVSNGIETIREIIRGSANRKLKSMSISFKNKDLTYSEIFKLKSELVGVTVGKILKDFDIVENRPDHIPSWVQKYIDITGETLYNPRHVLIMEFNPVLLYQYNISLPQIIQEIKNYNQENIIPKPIKNIDNLMKIIPSPMSEKPTIIVFPNEEIIPSVFEMQKKNKDKDRSLDIQEMDPQLSYMFLKVIFISDIENKIYISGVEGIEQLFPQMQSVWQIVQEELVVYSDTEIAKFPTLQERQQARRRWLLFYNVKNLGQKGIPRERLDQLLNFLNVDIIVNPDIDGIGLEVEMPSPEEPKTILREYLTGDLLSKIRQTPTEEGWTITYPSDTTQEQIRQWSDLFVEENYEVIEDNPVYNVIPQVSPIVLDSSEQRYFTLEPTMLGYVIRATSLPPVVYQVRGRENVTYSPQDFLRDTLTKWKNQGYKVTEQHLNPHYTLERKRIYSGSQTVKRNDKFITTPYYTVRDIDGGYMITVDIPNEDRMRRDFDTWSRWNYDIQWLGGNQYRVMFKGLPVSTSEYTVNPLDDSTAEVEFRSMNRPRSWDEIESVFNVQEVKLPVYTVNRLTTDDIVSTKDLIVTPAEYGVNVEMKKKDDKILESWRNMGFIVNRIVKPRSELRLKYKRLKPSELFNNRLRMERKEVQAKIKENKGKRLPEPTPFLRLAEYGIADTNGCNLLETFLNPHVDPYFTTSNSFSETLAVLGIEAVRTLILREILDVFAAQDAVLDPRHLLLIVDVMTNSGIVLGISYSGVGAKNATLLAQVSMEKTQQKFLQAAATGRSERLLGASTAITVGAPIQGGTGLVRTITTPEYKKVLETAKAANLNNPFNGGIQMNSAIAALNRSSVSSSVNPVNAPNISQNAQDKLPLRKPVGVSQRPSIGSGLPQKSTIGVPSGLPTRPSISKPAASTSNLVNEVRANAVPISRAPNQIISAATDGNLRTNVLKPDNAEQKVVIASTSTNVLNQGLDQDAYNKALEDLFS